MKRIMIATLIATFVADNPAFAQGGTDIFVATLSDFGTSVRVGTPKNITRRPGYDNQPAFTANSRSVLYTSQREGQTDIYRYDVAADSSVQVTRTPESEYSATLLPDGSGFSVIQVERDSTQRLWSFGFDGTRPRLVLTNVKPVGYHAWANSREVVMFILGEPATLQRASVTSGKSDTVIRNPGRSIHRIPGTNAVSFVHKKSEKEWWIHRLDMLTGKLTDLVRTLPGSEDYAWTPSGIVLMAKDETLYSWNPAVPKQDWQQVMTFAKSEMPGIKRLAVSADGRWLALVADEKN
jgi:hypothetical protein